MSDELLLSVEGLTSGYGAGSTLHGVDLDLRTDEIVALIGSNGAGKTTLVRAIGGLLRARTGTISLRGERVERHSVRARARLGIITVPEGRRLFQRLTVAENVAIGRRISRGRPGGTALLDLAMEIFPALPKLWRTQAGLLSGGQQQMVAIARGIAANPRVLLLDEPTLGLSPALSDEVLELVSSLARSSSLSILLVEQRSDHALRIADRGYVMDRGNITLSGSSAELLAHEGVRAAYLGR
jgi:branched-chain amino acid transport system ATP-binding protein